MCVKICPRLAGAVHNLRQHFLPKLDIHTKNTIQAESVIRDKPVQT